LPSPHSFSSYFYHLIQACFFDFIQNKLTASISLITYSLNVGKQLRHRLSLIEDNAAIALRKNKRGSDLAFSNVSGFSKLTD